MDVNGYKRTCRPNALSPSTLLKSFTMAIPSYKTEKKNKKKKEEKGMISLYELIMQLKKEK